MKVEDDLDSKRPSKNSIDIHSHVFDDEYQTDLDVTVETLPDDGRIGGFILFGYFS